MSRKKANVEAENSLRDRSYCWRVLSDQVRVNNIGFVECRQYWYSVFGVANDRPVYSAAYAYQYCLPNTV